RRSMAMSALAKEKEDFPTGTEINFWHVKGSDLRTMLFGVDKISRSKRGHKLNDKQGLNAQRLLYGFLNDPAEWVDGIAIVRKGDHYYFGIINYTDDEGGADSLGDAGKTSKYAVERNWSK